MCEVMFYKKNRLISKTFKSQEAANAYIIRHKLSEYRLNGFYHIIIGGVM